MASFIKESYQMFEDYKVHILLKNIKTTTNTLVNLHRWQTYTAEDFMQSKSQHRSDFALINNKL